MTKEEVISNLKKVASQLKGKEYITLNDFRSIPGLEYYVYFYFGKLGIALQAADLPSSKLAASMKITSEDLLRYLADLRDKLHHNPSVYDIGRDEEIYKKYSERKFTWALLKTRFGGLKKALEQMELKSERESKKNKQGQEIFPIEEVKNEDPEFSKEKNRFFGKAAELHVTAELIYHGFQATNIPIDVGMDILAIKNNKTFYFQVKHKDLNSNKPVELTKASFERSGGGMAYYIFVLLSNQKRDFLIIPYHIVNDWIRLKLAEDSGDKYLIYIKKEENHYKVKDRKLDDYLDKWEYIK